MARNVTIKVNANACRRVKWDTKLGLNKHSIRFHIKLSSIRIDGGMIHRIKAQVRRVIPFEIGTIFKLNDSMPIFKLILHFSRRTTVWLEKTSKTCVRYTATRKNVEIEWRQVEHNEYNSCATVEH